MTVKKKRFKAAVLTGHKESAVEVPFNPTQEWKTEPQPLWRGRRGHPAEVVIKDVSFESAIVPRQKKYYLLVDRESQRSAQVSDGDMVTVTVHLKTS